MSRGPETSNVASEAKLDVSKPAEADPQAEAALLKKEAVAVAMVVAEVYPDDALSHALLGSAYYNTGRSEEATRHLRRCLKLNPDQADAYEILARIAYEKGDLENSIGQSREALKRGQPSAEVLSQLGRALMDLGRTDEAIQVLEQATGLQRTSSDSYYLLGQARLQSGDPARAKSSFQEAIRLLPDHTQAYFGLYTASMRLGETNEAAQFRDRFRQLEAVDRRSLTDRSAQEDTLSGLPLVRKTVARTFFGAGQVYRLHKEQDQAIGLFERAALLDPDSPTYRAALEMVCVQSDAVSEGIRAFERLAAAQPQNGWNHYFLGRLQERAGQSERVELAFGRVQQLMPGWAEGYRALAEHYLRKNVKNSVALAMARKAAELEPSGTHYYLLAVARSRNGDRAGAVEAIQQAITLEPTEPRYRELLEQLKGAR